MGLSECKCTRCELERQIEILKAREANTITAMKSQTEMLRDRIQRALNVLRVVDRYDTDGVDPDTWCGSEVTQAVDSDIVDQVIQILEGKNDGQAE